MTTRLEYRRLDERNGFPVLYYYDFIDKDEIALRFACDYFVKDGLVYEKTSCAIEISCYVIYVQVAEDEKALKSAEPVARQKPGIMMEVREFKEGTAHYPVVCTYTFQDDADAILHLQSQFLYLYGREWERTSTEIDEDRGVYVYYAQPTA
ncbi:hypothetical protein [Aneurinibacillus aneurinilyticus]|uniref:Uncharacterized protein n=1 Tax=Aneurinibacillus aneurinilyticus ATCC 12856 TaxID=649747 RepID=U1YDI3_ANEAE|nr:hypothetical protein [Aneurinibacillus aneurinilyticus]ERI08821.1 hypothetical protein HMPREF0083_03103 [Aneurinibacillus aneurinilyticus ATCC 12856]MCI1695030.1 hypothetical protein [Aneurinibacillus aneurinilyticus]MED0670443.1 hypothetical protein [Aneurinibacillus aneurinilyticus]MED0706658.1 hypothetical protein [Aneurinibacillus aneurinilyticus]MED0723579.1 hypothetical protein [Aneurinibacillus aneurinilyticus]